MNRCIFNESYDLGPMFNFKRYFHFILKGTIVSWTVSVGQTVKEGDVVALVETDKVTVDIKAQKDGLITAQFGKL